MGWNTLPATKGDKIIDDWYDEVKAAIDERADVVGTAKPAGEVDEGDENEWAIITDYRAKIGLLIPKFYVKSGSGTSTIFTPWTLAAIMTECFETTDWPNKNKRKNLVSHWNNMQSVINKLEWTDTDIDSGSIDYSYIHNYEGGATWADCINAVVALLTAGYPQVDDGLLYGSARAQYVGHGWEATGVHPQYTLWNDWGIYEIRFADDFKINFTTSKYNGTTILDAYVILKGRTPAHDVGNDHYVETTSIVVEFESGALGTDDWEEGYVPPNYKTIAYQISSPDSTIDKSGTSELEMNPTHDETYNPGVANWPEPPSFPDPNQYNLYNRSVWLETFLFCQIQFEYRA